MSWAHERPIVIQYCYKAVLVSSAKGTLPSERAYDVLIVLWIVRFEQATFSCRNLGFDLGLKFCTLGL
jgi:hypothetical protein